MTRRNARLGGKIFTALVFLFLYAPIFVLIVFSFNSSKSRTTWTGFSFKWYAELFQNDAIMSSLYTTLLVAVISALIATVLGTFAALGFYTMKKRWRNPLLEVNNIPLMNADVVTGVSLCLLFVAAAAIMGDFTAWINKIFGTDLKTNFHLGFATLLIAHISFNTPYVILSVMPKLYQLDRNLVDAAQDLGCTFMQAFFKVVVPQIMPGIVNGIIIAFTMSIDDFVISYFTAGSTVNTLSMTIYAMARRRVSPEINAISTLLFLAVLILLVIINLREIRQEDKKKRLQKAIAR
ncbi:MAG: ABC transporter permease [Oscillospiraceae bacterium]|nr:ABC transporter permease [Oscillospiraceae bacterium]